MEKLDQKIANFTSPGQKYQETGDKGALDSARSLIENLTNISSKDKSRLEGFIEGSGIMLLNEPQPLTTNVPKLNGLDEEKCRSHIKIPYLLLKRMIFLRKNLIHAN